MLVGNAVNIANSGQIQVSHTTIMPEMNGIIPLVYMVFAPKRSMRKYLQGESSSVSSGKNISDHFTGKSLYTVYPVIVY